MNFDITEYEEAKILCEPYDQVQRKLNQWKNEYWIRVGAFEIRDGIAHVLITRKRKTGK